MMPAYYDLLYKAHEASRRVDSHDVRSEDTRNLETWRSLIRHSHWRQVRLIEYIRDHAGLLLDALRLDG